MSLDLYVFDRSIWNRARICDTVARRWRWSVTVRLVQRSGSRPQACLTAFSAVGWPHWLPPSCWLANPLADIPVYQSQSQKLYEWRAALTRPDHELDGYSSIAGADGSVGAVCAVCWRECSNHYHSRATPASAKRRGWRRIQPEPDSQRDTSCVANLLHMERDPWVARQLKPHFQWP